VYQNIQPFLRNTVSLGRILSKRAALAASAFQRSCFAFRFLPFTMLTEFYKMLDGNNNNNNNNTRSSCLI